MSSVAESGLRASFQIESKRLGGDHENNTIWRLNTWICIFLQTNSSPKYLLFAILPLSTLLFTRELGLSLEFFGRVQNDNRQIFNGTIGWQAGTRIHNFGIFTALILMCIFGLEGQPWKITWPVLLAAPIGLVEVWLVVRITEGAKPLWKMLSLAANALGILPAYFLLLAIWIR